MKHIIGLGEILWDLLPTGRQLGGAPANFAYHIQSIGLNTIQTYIASCVGNDKEGHAIRRDLTSLGINHDYLKIDLQHKTGSVRVYLDDHGAPDYEITGNVAWDFIPTISPHFMNSIDAVCFGTLAQRSPLSAQSIITFLDTVPKTALRLFDINLRQQFYTPDIIHQSLKRATIFKVNSDELHCIGSLFNLLGSENQMLATLSERYSLQLCILTKGAQGSLLYTKSQKSVHNGLNVEIKDSVGAGDAFTAAIAFGVLNNFELDYIHACANQLAAFVCSQQGATPKLPPEIINLFN
ncbi:MAG: carbohydrate kinase [Methylococcales bacterium]|nr:carbohydrate kinase [Methylococcales bacterium]